MLLHSVLFNRSRKPNQNKEQWVCDNRYYEMKVPPMNILDE